MPPDAIERRGVTSLGLEPVGEVLGVVGAVAHARRAVSQADAGRVEQGGVRVADDVPAHALLVEITEGGDQGVVRVPVVAPDGKLEALEDGARPAREWHDALSLLALGVVLPVGPVAGAPHAQVGTIDVGFADGDDLAPAQPGEQHELGDPAPHSGHVGDDALHLRQGEVVLAGARSGDAGSIDRKRQAADHPTPHGVLEGGREDRVGVLDGGRGVPLAIALGGHHDVGESDQMLGPDVAHGDVSHDGTDVGDTAGVGHQGADAGFGVAPLEVVPGVEGIADGLAGAAVVIGQRTLGDHAVGTDGTVDLFPLLAPANEPHMVAGVPAGPAAFALLAEAGHSAESMRSQSEEASNHAASGAPSRRAGSSTSREFREAKPDAARSERGVGASEYPRTFTVPPFFTGAVKNARRDLLTVSGEAAWSRAWEAWAGGRG